MPSTPGVVLPRPVIPFSISVRKARSGFPLRGVDSGSVGAANAVQRAVQILVLLAVDAAEVLQRNQFELGEIDPPGDDVAFAEIFVRVDVVGVDG